MFLPVINQVTQPAQSARKPRKPLTEEQREKAREANRRWKARQSPDKIRENLAKRHQKALEASRRWKANNPNKEKLWKEQNRDKVLAAKKRYREKNREKINQYFIAWRLKRRDGNPKAVVRPPVGVVLTQQLLGDAIYAAAFKAVPRTLPSYVRDDVISEIVLAVIEERIAAGDIAKRAQEFVKGYWREFGHMRRVSLDQLAYGEGRTTVGDNLTYDDVAW